MECLKNPDSNEDIPLENVVCNVFKTLFESNSLSDNVLIRLVERDEESDARRSSVITPIMAEEISECQKRIRHSAPEIDRVTVGELYKVDCHILSILFNGLLVCGNLPTMWKKNFTVDSESWGI